MERSTFHLEAVPKLDPGFDITHFVMMDGTCIGLVRIADDPGSYWAEAYIDGLEWDILPYAFPSPHCAGEVLARRKLYGPSSKRMLVRQRN